MLGFLSKVDIIYSQLNKIPDIAQDYFCSYLYHMCLVYTNISTVVQARGDSKTNLGPPGIQWYARSAPFCDCLDAARMIWWGKITWNFTFFVSGWAHHWVTRNLDDLHQPKRAKNTFKKWWCRKSFLRASCSNDSKNSEFCCCWFLTHNGIYIERDSLHR